MCARRSVSPQEQSSPRYTYVRMPVLQFNFKEVRLASSSSLQCRLDCLAPSLSRQPVSILTCSVSVICLSTETYTPTARRQFLPYIRTAMRNGSVTGSGQVCAGLCSDQSQFGDDVSSDRHYCRRKSGMRAFPFWPLLRQKQLYRDSF